MATKAELRKQFPPRAKRIAQAASPAAKPIPRSPSQSKYFAYFEEGDKFILVASGDPELEPDTKFALALGLGYANGRPLQLVLPDGATAQTTVRVPFLRQEVEVVAYSEDESGVTVQNMPRMTASEAFQQARSWGTLADIDYEMRAAAYANGAAWAIDLMDWVMTRRVDTTVRPSYVAWHYQGRQVLRIKPVGVKLEIRAGVQYSKPPSDQPQPIAREFSVSETPSLQALTQIQQAVDLAIENRRTGVDSGHREHALQATLLPLFERFELTSWYREFPAARPDSKRAFIDFLGIDRRGGLHVVETKIGPDQMLVMQGLDYWIWMTANAADVADHLGLKEAGPAEIDFVVAKKGSLFHPLTPAQAAALSEEVTWRFHTVSDWERAETINIQSFPEGSLPS